MRTLLITIALLSFTTGAAAQSLSDCVTAGPARPFITSDELVHCFANDRTVAGKRISWFDVLKALRRGLAVNIKSSTIVSGLDFQDWSPAAISLSGAALAKFCPDQDGIGPKWVCKANDVFRAVSAPLTVIDSEFADANGLMTKLVFMQPVVLRRNRLPGRTTFDESAFLGGLDLSGSVANKLFISNVAVQGGAKFDHMETNLFGLSNAVVSGDLSFVEVRMQDDSVHFDNLRIEGSLDMTRAYFEKGLAFRKSNVSKGVVLKRAIVGGELYFSELDAGYGDLSELRATAKFTVYSSVFKEPVSIANMTVGADMTLSRITLCKGLSGPSATATIAGNFDLNILRSFGPINLRASAVSGSSTIRQVNIFNQLLLEGVQIGGKLEVSESTATSVIGQASLLTGSSITSSTAIPHPATQAERVQGLYCGASR